MRASHGLLAGAALAVVAALAATGRSAQADPVDPDVTITCPPRDEPLQCVETHLNEAAPNPDGKACTTRADCSPVEFCGAGTCRTLDGELATLCVDKLWVEGAFCGDLDHVGASVFTERRWKPDPLLLSLERDLDESDACDVVAVHECTTVSLEVVAESLLNVSRYVGGPGWKNSTHVFISGEQGILDWLESGCVSMEPGFQHGSVGVQGQVSLWYP